MGLSFTFIINVITFLSEYINEFSFIRFTIASYHNSIIFTA